MNRKIVYIAHPLGDGPDRAENCKRAAKWVAWAAEQGTAPVCTWIVLASQWDESRREEGLDVDCRLIEVCDEVWACGPRVSPGMNVELTHAKKKGIPCHILVNPLFIDGPPQRKATFQDLLQTPRRPMARSTRTSARWPHTMVWTTKRSSTSATSRLRPWSSRAPRPRASREVR